MPSVRRRLDHLATEHPLELLGGAGVVLLLVVVLAAWASGPADRREVPRDVDVIAVGEEHRSGELATTVEGAHLAHGELTNVYRENERSNLLVVELTVENLTDEPVIDPFEVASLHVGDLEPLLDYTLRHPDGSMFDAFQPALRQPIQLVFEVSPDAVTGGDTVTVALWDRHYIEDDAGFLPYWGDETLGALVRVPVEEGGL